MMTKIEMQAMDAVIGIHREMRKGNEPNWEQLGMRLQKMSCAPCSPILNWVDVANLQFIQ